MSSSWAQNIGKHTLSRTFSTAVTCFSFMPRRTKSVNIVVKIASQVRDAVFLTFGAPSNMSDHKNRRNRFQNWINQLINCAGFYETKGPRARMRHPRSSMYTYALKHGVGVLHSCILEETTIAKRASVRHPSTVDPLAENIFESMSWKYTPTKASGSKLLYTVYLN